MMRIAQWPGAKHWLHQLDSYTNAEFGLPRTLLAIQRACVACGGDAPEPDISGLCAKCAAKRRADDGEVVLFRPLRRLASTPTN